VALSLAGIETLRRTIRLAERRLRVDRALAKGAALGIPAALLLAAALLTERLRGLPPGGLDWAYATALALPLAGLAWGLLSPVHRRRLATRVDAACRLHDRLGTAWSITAGGTRPPPEGFPAAAVHDAARHLDEADPARAVPLQLPRAFRPLLLAVLAAAVSAWVPAPELAPSGHLPLLPRETPPLLAEDELEVQREAARRLEKAAREERDDKLARVAEEIAQLVDRLEERSVDRKHAFERLNALERKLKKGAEESEAAEKAAKEAVKEAAKALKRHDETKELAKALEKGDLKAAEQALKRLADLMEKVPLSRGLLEKLAKAFEKTAKKLAERFDSEMRKELADEMRRLRELLRKQGLSEREKERLQELQRKLEAMDKARQAKLGGDKQPTGSPERTPGRPRGAPEPQRGAKRDQADKPQSRAGMSRMVNRLSRRMEEMAKQLRQGQPEARQEAQKEAGEEMRKGVEEIRNLHRAMRQQQLRRKARQRLADLKEAMRRGRRQEVSQRARRFRQRAAGLRRRPRGPGERMGGQRGRGLAGRGRPGKELKRKGESGVGAGTAPGRGSRGQASKTGGRYQEHFVEGQESEGPMLQEVVLDAAKRGFSQTKYRDAYGNFRDVAEEELARERIPAGYRHHVKRYFDLIRPDAAEEPGEDP